MGDKYVSVFKHYRNIMPSSGYSNGTVGSVLTEQVMVTNGWTSAIVSSSLRLIIKMIIL